MHDSACSCQRWWEFVEVQTHLQNSASTTDSRSWYQQVSAKRACPDCVGSGSRPGSRPVFCELCRGSGAVSAHHAGFSGEPSALDTCLGIPGCCRAHVQIPLSQTSTRMRFADVFLRLVGSFCAGTVRAPFTAHPSGAGSGMRWDIPCPACGARGVVRQEWCTRCGGDGRAASTVTLSVAIPAGQPMLQLAPSHEGSFCLALTEISSHWRLCNDGL